jgi:hypothetical protein
LSKTKNKDIFDRINRINRIFSCCIQHFPEESAERQSACGGGGTFRFLQVYSPAVPPNAHLPREPVWKNSPAELLSNTVLMENGDT